MSPSSISTSNRATLRGVCGRAAWFLAPLLLVTGFCEAVFWRSRECWPSPWVLAAWQDDPQTLYGPRYFASNIAWLKMEMMRRKPPQIVALGSSRVTQFRAPMFGQLDGRFFNAGHLVTDTSEFVAMAAHFQHGRLPKPRVLIVGIDPWWMKMTAGRDARGDNPPATAEPGASLSGAAHLQAMTAFLMKPEFPASLFKNGKTVRNADYGRPAIGLGALRGNGYRSDGSVLQTSVIAEYLRTRTYRDRETPPVIQRIRGHTHQFSRTPGLDWQEAGRIIAAMTALKGMGVEIHSFLPPFSTEADKALREDDALSRWYAEYRDELPGRIIAAGIPCLDVRSPQTYGRSDDSMMDGFHPGDVLVSCILEDLIRRAPPGSVLGSLSATHLAQLREAPGVVPLSLDPPPARPR